MNLDGAENAKAEIFLRAFGYSEVASASSVETTPTVFVPAQDTEAFDDIVQARSERKLAAKEQIAIGLLRPVLESDHKSGIKIGLFVQRKKLVHHPVIEAARRIAAHETKIIVTGPVRRQAMNTARCRPLRIGASVGHFRVTAGTIGCFGRSRVTGKIGILSNNHVLANANSAKLGDAIYQPGRVDCIRKRFTDHHVAALESFVPIDFNPNAPNFVDCAFATLLDEVECDACSIGELAAGSDMQSIGEPDELVFDDTPVWKIGRTTGRRSGLVEAIGVDNVTVQMVGAPKPKYALFHQQIAISGTNAGGASEAFSKGGDSGAIVFVEDGRPVALLFAGTKTGGRNGRGITFANPIGPVLEALEIDIHT